MSHPLPDSFHYHGFPLKGRKAIYVRTSIESSVRHRQACGEAIHRWNEAVGARFLMTPDQGQVSITFIERLGTEEPFASFIGDVKPGGLTSLTLGNPTIYVRSDMQNVAYYEWVNIWAHEIGHCFGLADHPHDDINSIMSYQVSGRWLLSPSKEDVDSIVRLHGLADMRVRVEDLDGVENITALWHWDRYRGQGWRAWIPLLRHSTVDSLVPYETYQVRAKAEGLLGLRQPLHVEPGLNRWVYL